MRFRLWAVCAGLICLAVGASAKSLYEHPLLDGGGLPKSDPDFRDRLRDFIKGNGKGKTGEALLRSYFGKDHRNVFIPDLIAAYGKDGEEPVTALVFRGRTVDRLPNEPYVWVFVFAEDGAPVLSTPPKKPDLPVVFRSDEKNGCPDSASQLQIRLEGLAYENDNDSGINAMEFIKMYTGKQPSITEKKPVDSDCVAVDFTRTGPVEGTAIRKATAKFSLSKEAVYRIKFHGTGAQREAETNFSNMRLSWFGAGVGAGAVREDGWFKKATVKPYIFGHLYVSKFLNSWNRSLAVVGGIPLENKVDEAVVGLRWNPINEWKNPDFSRFGIVVGYDYHRPVDKFAGSGKQWRFIFGVDYKL